MKCKMVLTLGLSSAVVLHVALAAEATLVDLTSNGDFETGTTSDWVSFPTPNSTFSITGDAYAGSFAGEVYNPDETSAAVIKQANLGVGLINPSDAIEISFFAKGAGTVGGVVFAEFFSEIDGGGVSSSVLLGGAPLPLNSSYQQFTFPVTAGPDVSAGVTLQFAVVTGATNGSTSRLFVDNVSVVADVVPEPGAAALLGMGGIGAVLLGRRRKSLYV